VIEMPRPPKPVEEKRVRTTITIYKPILDFCRKHKINVSKVCELSLVKLIKKKFNIDLTPPDVKKILNERGFYNE